MASAHTACLMLCLSVASAWTDCAFPQVDWFALDEGVGISYTYALAAMNGNMYSGGYTKGNFAFVGVTDGADVQPVPSASIWGDTTSNVQSLYVAEVSSSGSMTKAWLLKGSAIQIGQIGHGKQTNSIDAHSGMHAMLDKQHIAVKGGFRQLLELPDGTLWSSASRINTNDQVPFVMSIDVSSTQGIGGGTTGWAKVMDDGHAGGANVYSVDGDTDGNMIVTYEGCGGFNSSLTSSDAYGRPIQGATTDCVKYVVKLAAADGSEVWKYEIPTRLSSCRAITDGSFFCGWSMSASAGTLDFGNSVTVASEDSRVGIIKYNANGIALWAKATASTSFGDLAVSKTGTLLAVVGSTGGRGAKAVLSRIDTSSGNEGNVLWSDAGGVGTHGLRGVEVTDDDKEVFAFGQITGTETLTDTSGRATTLRSRGSYEVFVVAYDATDGTGKYAMDGGGTGMEYFFAMASDPDTHDIYIGGTSRSEYITWGVVSRKNVMYNGEPGKNNPDTSSPVGSSKAFAVKLKSTLTVPSCLTTCNVAFPLQASDVKSGHCYIDRHCYADGTSSPYSGSECTRCDSAVDPLNWSPPDTSAACFINDACVASGAHAQVRAGRSYVDDPCLHCDPSIDSSAYSPVSGCELPSTFRAGCYTDSGSEVMSLAAMMAENETNHMLIASMQASNGQLGSEVESLKTQVTVLQTKLDDSVTFQQTESSSTAETSCGSVGDDVAIALLVIVSVMLVITIAILVFLILKERRGVPVFRPAGWAMGTPVESIGGASTYGSSAAKP
eukprot:TRINITY_DN13071_c0_g1_i1.p1 TRINITY_DN13071_c0_g1~~TRINITY_DN13071_c0_g1_i1.p1  ORF type:complete len:779 (-),score=116.57 TRINITY_DN13071_c0_g1_i1:73-2409(-)